MLLAWNAIAPEGDAFSHDERGAYIPRNAIEEAIESALVFYRIKKDKALEAKVKKLILAANTRPKLRSLAKDIKKEVFARLPYDVTLPEKIYLPEDGIERVAIERFDFGKKEFVERSQKEVFKGEIDLQIEDIDKLRAPLLSYARGLAEYEHKELADTVLEPYIAALQNAIANEWEMTLRIGAWTATPYKGDLFFFWRIKEVREKLLRDFKLDILPKDISFIPKYKEFVGWCEYRND